MSVQSEITRLETAKSDIATAITNKGVTVPSGTKLDGMAALIGNIESGGGSGGGGGEETSTVYISSGSSIASGGPVNGFYSYVDVNGVLQSVNITKTTIKSLELVVLRGTCVTFPISQSAPLSVVSDGCSFVSGNMYSSVSKNVVLYITGTNAIFTSASCFLPDTLITLANGTKKQIKDLTYSDTLRVWNFDEGKFDSAPICWLTRSGLMNDHYYKLIFSDGTVLKTTGQNSNHKVYNVDERFFKGVDKTEIGDRIFSENGIVTVVDKEYIEEEVEYYNLITTGTINCFAQGILTSDRYGNLYPIDENMVYIKEGVEIRPYSEFEAVGIKRYWYDTLRLGEVNGTVEQTKDYIMKLECQMLTPPGYDE